MSCPGTGRDRLSKSRPGLSNGEILSLTRCLGTMKKLLSLCPVKQDCLVLLETLPISRRKNRVNYGRSLILIQWTLFANLIFLKIALNSKSEKAFLQSFFTSAHALDECSCATQKRLSVEKLLGYDYSLPVHAIRQGRCFGAKIQNRKKHFW